MEHATFSIVEKSHGRNADSPRLLLHGIRQRKANLAVGVEGFEDSCAVSRGRTSVCSLRVASSTLSFDTNFSAPGAHVTRTNVQVHRGRQSDQLVWTGKRFVLSDVNPGTGAGLSGLQSTWTRLKNKVIGAFLPDKGTVTDDYWDWCKYRCFHRYFTQINQMFSTQCLLYALNLGAKKTLAASATINWMIKDGLGRLARMTVATSYAQNFDSEIKRVRWTSALIFSTCIACEYATPFFPRFFVPLAGIANVGKAVALTAFISTQPAVMRSFSREENLADISAKCQAQNMVMDNLGIATAAWLTWLVRKDAWWRLALPLTMYPISVAGDLFGIHQELKSVHLRTLNKSRAEMLFAHLLSTGEVLTPAAVSAKDHLLLPPDIDCGPFPLHIGSIEDLADSPEDLQALLASQGNSRYLLRLRGPKRTPPWPATQAKIVLAMRQDTEHRDVLTAVLAACIARHCLVSSTKCAHCLDPVIGGPAGRGATEQGKNTTREFNAVQQGEGGVCLQEAVCEAKRAMTRIERLLEAQGWQCQAFLLSKSERVKFSIGNS